jgi:hypothetical protein
MLREHRGGIYVNTIPSASRPRVGQLLTLALAAALVSAALPQLASAHDHRHVGHYDFTVGFMVEPAFEGIANGVDLRIMHDDEPVEGAEETLQVEVLHVETGISRVFDLRALWGQPGRYTADFVPTAIGRYVFTFTGTLGDLDIHEEFEGGTGRFADVESIATVQFPETVVSAREMQGAVMGVRDTALDAENAAASARTLAIVGIAVGALGLAAGGAGIYTGTRRREA